MKALPLIPLLVYGLLFAAASNAVEINLSNQFVRYQGLAFALDNDRESPFDYDVYLNREALSYDDTQVPEVFGAYSLFFTDEVLSGEPQEVSFSLFEREDYDSNRIAFTPAATTDVALNEPFLLGRMSWQNRSWFAAKTPFTVTMELAVSSTDAQIDGTTQTLEWRIESTTNSGNDPDSGADQIYLACCPGLGGFRAYEIFEKPAGVAHAGSFELWGKLTNSGLQITGFRNASNGFLTPSTENKLARVPEPNEPFLLASVLPSSRSVEIDATATAFATVLNAGTADAIGCRIEKNLFSDISTIDLLYQTTDPATNQLTGVANTPVDIPAGGLQTFLIGATPTTDFGSNGFALRLDFVCDNARAAESIAGLNRLRVSTGSNAPDIIALSATITNDGIAHIDPASLTGVFSVASINVGGAGDLLVTADTGGADLPVSLGVCQTDPVTSICINPSAPTLGAVSVNIGANETPTFAIFTSATDSVQPDPALARAVVRFTEADGTQRGSTSVALQTDSTGISAGPNQATTQGASVRLTGDPGSAAGPPVTEEWRQLSGALALIESPSERTTEVVLPEANCTSAYVFGYSATYANGATFEDEVRVTTASTVPAFTVNAGSTQVLPVNQRMSLMASTSLQSCHLSSITWEQLSGASVATATFGAGSILEITAPQDLTSGRLTFRVTVTAINGTAVSDDVSIDISSTTVPAPLPVTPNSTAFSFTGNNLYLARPGFIEQLDVLTGESRTIIGGTGTVQYNSRELSDVGNVQQLVAAGDQQRLYFNTFPFDQIKQVSLDAGDGLSTFERLADPFESPADIDSFYTNGDRTFFVQRVGFEDSELYSRPISSESPATLLTTLDRNYRLDFANQTHLYLTTSRSDLPAVIRLRIADGAQESVVAPQPGGAISPSEAAITGNLAYWLIQDQVFEVDLVTLETRILANVALQQRILAAEPGAVYWVQGFVGSGEKLVRLDTSTLEQTQIVDVSEYADLAFSNGSLYLLAPNRTTNAADIYRLTGGALEFVTAFPEMRNSIELTGGGNWLLVHSGSLGVLNTANGSQFSTAIPSGNAGLNVVGDNLYLGGRELYKYALGASPRRAQTFALAPPDGEVLEILRVDDEIVWLGLDSLGSDLLPKYRIRARNLDGTGERLLYGGTDRELANLSIVGGRIYFACFDDCGVGNWALASVPISGGGARFESKIENPLVGGPPLLLGGNDTVVHLSFDRIEVFQPGDSRFTSVSRLRREGFEVHQALVGNNLFLTGVVQSGDSEPTQLVRFQLNGAEPLSDPQEIPLEQSGEFSQTVSDLIAGDNELLIVHENQLKRFSLAL